MLLSFPYHFTRPRCSLYLVFACILLAVVATSCGGTRHITSYQDAIYDNSDKTIHKEKPKDKPRSNAMPSTVAEALIIEARTWIGTPYVYGGQDRKGTDCSGFTMQVFSAAAGIQLPRVSRDQYTFCEPLEKEELHPGDLIFFSSGSSGSRIAHVGMYIGNGKMIHASSSKGVIESAIDSNYYLKHYVGSGRVPGVHEKKPQKKAESIKTETVKAGPVKQEPVKAVTKPKDPPQDIQSQKKPEEPSPESVVKNAFGHTK